jgi:RND family efflux transporter MFP subunit
VNAVRILLQILVPLAILGGGGFLAVRIAQAAKKPAVVDAPPAPPLVRVAIARTQDVTITVAAQGVVEPLRVAELTAEVPGRIVAVNPGLRAGAMVAAGETLASLDVADFDFAIAQQAAAVARAELRLAQERAEADAALRAWRELEGDTAPDALVARLPQIRDAEGALAAARAALQKAERDRARAEIKAPFAGRVRSVAAEIGQLAQPGVRLATIVDDASVEVRLPVAVGEAAFVDLPLHDELPLGQGAPVAFTVEFAGATHAWHGHVVRTEGEVDRRTRQLTVVARIEDARGAAPADGRAQKPPLLVGQFVQARIQGRTFPGCVVLPRDALVEGSSVWIVGDDSLLRRQPVEVLRAEADRVVLRGGLPAGARALMSKLAAAEGMRVTVADGEAGR